MNDEKQILLAEYKEACDNCRSIEITTKSTMVFTPILIALLGYLPNTLTYFTIFYGYVGVIACLTAFTIILRNQAHYSSYMSRIHQIEEGLGMKLYRNYKNRGINFEDLPGKIGNKRLLANLFAMISVLFQARIIYILFHIFDKRWLAIIAILISFAFYIFLLCKFKVICVYKLKAICGKKRIKY